MYNSAYPQNYPPTPGQRPSTPSASFNRDLIVEDDKTSTISVDELSGFSDDDLNTSTGDEILSPELYASPAQAYNSQPVVSQVMPITTTSRPSNHALPLAPQTPPSAYGNIPASQPSLNPQPPRSGIASATTPPRQAQARPNQPPPQVAVVPIFGNADESSKTTNTAQPKFIKGVAVSAGFSDGMVSSVMDSAARLVLPNPGDIFENYEILELLGEGGFGAVYRAKNLTLGREEALKIILPEVLSDNKNSDKRFLREVDVISRIEHPNIVRLYNSGTRMTQGLLWMSMELIAGSRLDHVIATRKKLPFDEAKEILDQLLSGLQEAQRLQLIHRDLKPTNIMLTHKEGYGTLAIILDFGLAKALGAEENSQIQQLSIMTPKYIMGTPHYMAPEQFQPDIPAGPYTDVYSVALIFIELLTGKKAVDGPSAVEVAYHQIKEEVPLPSLWTGTALEYVIRKATAKDPANRYQSAREFHKDIDLINDISDDVESFLKKQKNTPGKYRGVVARRASAGSDSNSGSTLFKQNQAKVWFLAFVALIVIDFIMLIIYAAVKA